MTAAGAYWKDDIDDLKSRALPVLEQTSDAPARMSARQAAAVLSGIVGHIARTRTLDHAQRACAELVRFEPVWATSFGRLPHRNGYISEDVALVATVARSLLPLAGVDALRAALSFWATEDDPAAWQRVAAV